MSGWKAVFEKYHSELVPIGYSWEKDAASKSLLQVSVPMGNALAPLDVIKVISCSCTTDQPCASDRCMC